MCKVQAENLVSVLAALRAEEAQKIREYRTRQARLARMRAAPKLLLKNKAKITTLFSKIKSLKLLNKLSVASPSASATPVNTSSNLPDDEV